MEELLNESKKEENENEYKSVEQQDVADNTDIVEAPTIEQRRNV